MPLGLIFKRLKHHARMYGLILLTLCVTGGFLSLGPIYTRAVTESALRYTLRGSTDDQFALVIRHTQPLDSALQNTVRAQMGAFMSGVDTSSYMNGVLCGLDYQRGAPVSNDLPHLGRPGRGCPQAFAYPDLQKLFRLVRGRWPATVTAQASDQPTVEAIITGDTARLAPLDLASRVIIGEDASRYALVEIVGIVEPLIPTSNGIWINQNAALHPQLIPVGQNDRYDYGLIVTPEAFTTRIVPTLSKGSWYQWFVGVHLENLNADTLDALNTRLRQLELDLRLSVSTIEFRTALQALINDFYDTLSRVEGPVFLLSGAILLLMLYQLSITSAMLLDEQTQELAIYGSRGSSRLQMLRLQAMIVGVMSVLSFVVGPFIGQGILAILARIGPLAAVLDNAAGLSASIPANAVVMSAIGAILALIVLTIPAWRAARTSLLSLQQRTGRPVAPLWQRYYLDMLLLIGGAVLLLRLYFFVTPDGSIDALLRDPGVLIRLLNGTADLRSLNDPFNFAIPALLLTGFALLWLRLFSVVIRLLVRLGRPVRGLLALLPLWTLERDPGYYAYLALLLVCTLAVGTASLVLLNTHDETTWNAALQSTGAAARLEFRSGAVDARWRSFPGVSGGTALFRTETTEGGTGFEPTALFGIDPATFKAEFPGGDLHALDEAPPVQGAGFLLPEDAVKLRMMVYVESTNPESAASSLVISAMLRNPIGVWFALPLTPESEGGSKGFTRYSVDLPPATQWRFERLRFSRKEGFDVSKHALFLDAVEVIRKDGTAQTLDDFEVPNGDWQYIPNISLYSSGSQPVRVGSRSAQGGFSLHVEVTIDPSSFQFGHPDILIRPRRADAVPVIVSKPFAAYYGLRDSSLRRELQVGDDETVDLALPLGTLSLHVHVVGIADGFNTTSAQTPFLVARLDTLLPGLNANNLSDAYYDVNQVWVKMNTRQPLDTSALQGVVKADFAWDTYNILRRDPLSNAIIGILLVGFWASFALGVLDFGFHLAMTTRKREASYAVLRALGWNKRKLWGALGLEQAMLALPAVLIGVALGVVLAQLLLPFMSLMRDAALMVPWSMVGQLAAITVLAFVALLSMAILFLRNSNLRG